ncbi:MAG: hypothetical protein PHX54_03740 [Lentimicrobiaceae bacterium]|nr:hypothetical protein [Lentimicrobiaceae bacterium]
MTKKDNVQLFNKLRQSYPVFTYERFIILVEDNQLKLQFIFSLGNDIQFSPRIQISTGQSTEALNHLLNTNSVLIRNIVFHIGLIELVSYWKSACSPRIEIKAGHLSPDQAEWFKELFYNGLGEFFYTNGIQVDASTFVTIQSSGKETFNPSDYHASDNSFVVPIGGGKDSAVSLQLLLNHNYKVVPLIMNPRQATLDTLRVAGLSEASAIIINRSIDPLLLKLNEQGFLNGHTPFSAMLAFYTLLAATLKGFKNIALSNESSANEPTIPGTNINHQYSKTFEFEASFRHYYSRYITAGLNYFSFLRPLNEYRIMQIFSGFTQYHKVFRSCNVGSKTDSWCGSCSKCLFTHIMLSAFVGVKQADELIGASMLNDIRMQAVFEELTGQAIHKPFECVGTIDDVNNALNLIRQNHDNLPLLLNNYSRQLPLFRADMEHPLNDEHYVPNELIEILKQALR